MLLGCELLKKVIAIFLIFVITCFPVLAADKIKFYADMQTEFSDLLQPEEVEFLIPEDVIINEEITIPAGAAVKAGILQSQKERRWHKSGFFVCRLISYSVDEEEPVDLTEHEIHFVARKYEAINKKDASILGAEIILTQAASIVGSCFIFFAPVDIAYFFTKGAISKKKHPNWFRSGVMEAYDNSIFWFQLKGKPIELAEGDEIKLKSVTKEKAEKMTAKISKRKAKKAARQEKRDAKKAVKQEKREAKEALKLEKLRAKGIVVQEEGAAEGTAEEVIEVAAEETAEDIAKKAAEETAKETIEEYPVQEEL